MNDRELVERFARYVNKHTTWGSLHIVLDDGNESDSCVRYCIQWAEETNDTEGLELAKILLTLSESERSRLGDDAEALDRQWRGHD